MSGVLDRLARLFVEPADPVADAASTSAAPEAPVRWLPPVPEVAPTIAPTIPIATGRVAVVCSVADAVVAGGAVGMAMLLGSGASCALVATWTGEGPRAAAGRPALPGARRLAMSLRERGHHVRATGRLVRVSLPAGEDEAVAAANAAAAGSPPGVLVIAGPRGCAMEALLSLCDLILIATRADGGPELIDLAARELERLGPPVVTFTLPETAGSQALCREGLRLPAALRAALAPMTEA